jgi:hypothetical protein
MSKKDELEKRIVSLNYALEEMKLIHQEWGVFNQFFTERIKALEELLRGFEREFDREILGIISQPETLDE